MSAVDEPRTTVDIVRDLLGFVQEHEWAEVTHHCGRGCHCVRGHSVECPTCDAEQPNHKDDCRLAASIREAEAFIAAEEWLEQERDHVEAVPCHPE